MVSGHALGAAYVSALEQRDFARVAECMHPEVRLRALLPGSICEAGDAAEVIALLREWFGEAEELALVRQSSDDALGGLTLSYRFLAREEGEWQVVEQYAYCKARNGRIERMDLICSGFRPARGPGAIVGQRGEVAPPKDAAEKGQALPRADATLEAAGEGCATLTPRIRERVRALASGQVLEVRTDDPAAHGDLQSWCRLAGHELLARAEGGTEGARYFIRKK